MDNRFSQIAEIAKFLLNQEVMPNDFFKRTAEKRGLTEEEISLAWLQLVANHKALSKELAPFTPQ